MSLVFLISSVIPSSPNNGFVPIYYLCLQILNHIKYLRNHKLGLYPILSNSNKAARSSCRVCRHRWRYGVCHCISSKFKMLSISFLDLSPGNNIGLYLSNFVKITMYLSRFMRYRLSLKLSCLHENCYSLWLYCDILAPTTYVKLMMRQKIDERII